MSLQFAFATGIARGFSDINGSSNTIHSSPAALDDILFANLLFIHNQTARSVSWISDTKNCPVPPLEGALRCIHPMEFEHHALLVLAVDTANEGLSSSMYLFQSSDAMMHA